MPGCSNLPGSGAAWQTDSACSSQLTSCLPGSTAGCFGALWTRAEQMASVLRSLSASGFVTENWDTVRLVLHLPCCACRAPRRSGRPRQLPPGLSQDALDALPEPRRQQVDMLLADRAHASSANPAAVSALAAAASTCSGEGTTSCKCWYTSRTNPLRRCRQGATRPLTAVTVVAVYLRRQSVAIWVLTSLLLPAW